MNEFILASKSPRRRSLLQNLLDAFLVMDPDVEEASLPGELPADLVRRIAHNKVVRGADMIDPAKIPNAWIIAADTIVVDGMEIIGKPSGDRDAVRILRNLKGKTHQVLSSIALYGPGFDQPQTEVVCSDVEMREYTEDEIITYVASGDPLDKAGAYAIQNSDFDPAPDFQDCFANVMGLPLCHLAVLIRKYDLEYDPRVAQRCQASIEYQCPVYQQILG